MPRRKGGLFLPLDVGFPDDDRVVEAGERAAWLYVCMALASKRLGTDGLLTARQIERLHVTAWRERLARLIAVQLVTDLDPDLYAISSWFRHNDPVAVVQERRAKDAERKRAGVPNRLRTAAEPTRDVEKREEEKSTSGVPGTAPVGNVHRLAQPCPAHPYLPPSVVCSACQSEAKAGER